MATPLANIPTVVENQGSKEITISEADVSLEALSIGAAENRVTSSPPGSPPNGVIYILGPSPSGAWAAFDENDIVQYVNGAWNRYVPFIAQRFWDKSINAQVIYNGTSWVVTGAGVPGHVIQDPSGTPLTQRGNLQFTGTAVTSVVDDSGNDRTVVTLTDSSTATGLTALTANTEIYVSPTGDDMNDGLTPLTPKTVQGGLDMVATFNRQTFDLDIVFLNGTYDVTVPYVISSGLGSRRVKLRGETTTETNVILRCAASPLNIFSFEGVTTVYEIADMTFDNNVATAGLNTFINTNSSETVDLSGRIRVRASVVPTNNLQCLRVEEKASLRCQNSTIVLDNLDISASINSQLVAAVVGTARFQAVTYEFIGTNVASSDPLGGFIKISTNSSGFFNTVNAPTGGGTATGRTIVAQRGATVVLSSSEPNLPGDVGFNALAAEFAQVIV